MTKEETAKLVYLVTANYPKFYKNVTQSEFGNVVHLWHMCLEQYPYTTGEMALKAYVTTENSGFPPSVGQIIDCIHKFASTYTGKKLNEMEAWALVSKALRNGYYGAEEEFAKLPQLVQRAVGEPSQLRNWALTENETVETVIQSNFIRTYRAVLQENQQVSKLSPEIKNLLTANESAQLLQHDFGEVNKIVSKNYEAEEPPQELEELMTRLANKLSGQTMNVNKEAG